MLKHNLKNRPRKIWVISKRGNLRCKRYGPNAVEDWFKGLEEELREKRAWLNGDLGLKPENDVLIKPRIQFIDEILGETEHE